MKKPKLIIDEFETKCWYLNGKLHREDGPAIKYKNGNKCWYLNGKRHRRNGPACEYANGNKFWFLNDKIHRIDGPAIEWANGSKSWYINGKEVKEENIISYNITEKQYIKFIINL